MPHLLAVLLLASLPAAADHDHGEHHAPAAGFRAPAPYDLELLYKEAKAACPRSDLECFEKRAFHPVTMKHGPKAGIELFDMLRERQDLPGDVDGHHVVHHMGHHTAMAFGPTASAFALCPTSYNYGCLHGFFQHALGMGGTTEEAAAKICAEVEGKDVPSKHKFSCYHGLGHGIMMFKEHDLVAALKICNAFKTETAKQGCWQGVFMENIVGTPADEASQRKGLFSKTDPLAPCSRMKPRYFRECFTNHSGKLMQVFGNDLPAAARACLKAPAGGVGPCIETLSYLTTNPAWQASLVPGKGDAFFENAWELCRKFPDGHVRTCVLAGVDNIMNSGEADAARGERFCRAAGDEHRVECFRRIGGTLAYLTSSGEAARAKCRTLAKDAAEACVAALPAPPPN